MDGTIEPLVPEDILSRAPVVMVKTGETATADLRARLLMMTDCALQTKSIIVAN